MGTLYENKVKSIGDSASEFKEDGLFVTFGDEAPDALRDFCYIVDVKAVESDIVAGQKVDIDGTQHNITAVGNIAKQNLENLGHVTFSFTGETEAELPGAIYLEKADVPTLQIGSTITILA